MQRQITKCKYQNDNDQHPDDASTSAENIICRVGWDVSVLWVVISMVMVLVNALSAPSCNTVFIWLHWHLSQRKRSKINLLLIFSHHLPHSRSHSKLVFHIYSVVLWTLCWLFPLPRGRRLVCFSSEDFDPNLLSSSKVISQFDYIMPATKKESKRNQIKVYAMAMEEKKINFIFPLA